MFTDISLFNSLPKCIYLIEFSFFLLFNIYIFTVTSVLNTNACVAIVRWPRHRKRRRRRPLRSACTARPPRCRGSGRVAPKFRPKPRPTRRRHFRGRRFVCDQRSCGAHGSLSRRLLSGHRRLPSGPWTPIQVWQKIHWGFITVDSFFFYLFIYFFIFLFIFGGRVSVYLSRWYSYSHSFVISSSSFVLLFGCFTYLSLCFFLFVIICVFLFVWAINCIWFWRYLDLFS